jgi:hypothetical protein
MGEHTRYGNDSVTRDGAGHPEYSGKSVTRRAEDYRKERIEAGRYRTEPSGPGERPGGKSTARDTTGICPQDPIDPTSPDLRG